MPAQDEPTGHECDSAKREAQDIWGWARKITAGAETSILPTKAPTNPQKTKGGEI